MRREKLAKLLGFVRREDSGILQLYTLAASQDGSSQISHSKIGVNALRNGGSSHERDGDDAHFRFNDRGLLMVIIDLNSDFRDIYAMTH